MSGVATQRPDGATRIRSAFEAAAADGRAAFMPFMTAGFPDAERALAVGLALLRHADLMEVGLPFSDPLGDGPTVQRSSEAALKAGASTRGTLALVRELRRHSQVPIAVMTYYNPVYTYRGERGEGETAFVRDAAAAGVDALILPDLPPDEGPELIAAAREVGLGTVFLVAPTSTDARLKRVTADCRGFVYAVSVTGVTGARERLPQELAGLVQRTRAAGGLPVAVGFGVASAATAAHVATLADGVVVGSALVDKVARMRTPEDLAELESFAAELKAATRRT